MSARGSFEEEGDDSVEKSRIATWAYGDFSLQFGDWEWIGGFNFFDEDEVAARVLRREVTERYAHEEPGRRVSFLFLAGAFEGGAYGPRRAPTCPTTT